MKIRAHWRWWADPQTPGVGRETPHTIRNRYGSAADANKGSNPRRIDLADQWKFQLVDRPEHAPEDFAELTFNDAGWHSILVPHEWTLGPEGITADGNLRDRPQYTNVQMPWPGEPPEVPEHNPAGLYRRWFTPDGLATGEGFADDRLVLHVGGAESALAVWINGHFVGVHKDSRLPAEFDITPHLVEGPNLVAAMVTRWSDGTWIEDQDYWHLAGLHRAVHVHRTPRTYLADVAIRADLDARLTGGLLSLRIPVRFHAEPEADWTVRVRVNAPDGSEFLDATETVPLPRSDSATGRMADSVTYPGTTVVVNHTAPMVTSWNLERPELHTGTVSLIRPDGATAECVPIRFGFTRVEAVGRELLFNGQPVLIHGVNRHDHHPERGRALLRSDIEEDLLNIKRMGFNAVRTAHYPNDPQVLDLCDELGLLVIDEANVECHARARHLAHMPEFEQAIFDRIRRMVARDQNHPSIFAWSLGNEAGYAAVHDAAAAWLRRRQPHRIVHYEGAMQYTRWHDTPGQGAAASDLVCPMYPTMEQLTTWAGLADPRPLIMCEYSHAMGNSNGGLSAYWDLIESTPGLQGGFIWDWKDQGLNAKTAEGRPLWAFGGHFGHERHDSNFNCNGIVGPDGSPHPAMQEHRYLSRPVDIRHLSGDQIEVTSRQWFSDLADMTASWELTNGSAVVAEGTFAIPPVSPQKSQTVDVVGLSGHVAAHRAASQRPGDPGREALYFTAHVHTTEPSRWSPAGTHVVSTQTLLEPAVRSEATGQPARQSQRAPLTIRSRATSTTVENADGSVRLFFDTDSGALDHVEMQGQPIEMSAPVVSLWRAPTDNDGMDTDWTEFSESGRPLPPRQRWERQGLDRLTRTSRRLSLPEGRQPTNRFVVHSDWIGSDPGPAIEHRQEFAIENRMLIVEEEISVPNRMTDLPRIGITFTLAARYQDLEWHGRGPHETYPDRIAGSIVGTFATPIADQFVPFVKPQEHGFRCDPQWLTVSNPEADRPDAPERLRIGFDERVAGFSVLHHSAADLTAAAHLGELNTSPGTHVHIDAAMRGLGTASCGPDTSPEFRVRAGTRTFRWTLSLD